MHNKYNHVWSFQRTDDKGQTQHAHNHMLTTSYWHFLEGRVAGCLAYGQYDWGHMSEDIYILLNEVRVETEMHDERLPY